MSFKLNPFTGALDIAGSGAEKFTDLTDTPADYTGKAGNFVQVNAAETTLEFGLGAGAGAGYIATPDNGEVNFLPKAASATGARGAMFFSSVDDHIYVGTEV